MFAKRNLIAVGILAFLLSCNQPQHDTQDSQMSEISSVESKIPSSSAAVESNTDSSRKFIRTADIKFKVKNVFDATNAIEDITTRHGGFVTFTDLASSTEDVNTINISTDSLLETTRFTVSNSITLRVPNQNLDTVLKDISKNIAYLDYRIIKADDVGLQLLSNKRTQDRNVRTEGRLKNAVDKSGKNLNDIVKAEESISNKGEKIDEANITNLDLTDKINYSTVSLIVYQRQTVKTEFIPSYKNIDEYKPGFGVQFVKALQVGGGILESLIIALVTVWPLILISLIVLYFYKRKDYKIKKLVRSV